MRKLILVVFVFSLSGCAQMVPARVSDLGEGKYLLESSGNMFASIESLVAKIDKKATKLCGEAGYEYKDDGDFSTPHSPAYISGIDIGSSYKVLRREIKCK